MFVIAKVPPPTSYSIHLPPAFSSLGLRPSTPSENARARFISGPDEPVNAISLIIRCDCSGRLSLVHDELVTIRIAKLRHPAHRRFNLFHIEGDTAFFKSVDRGIDIFHLKGDRRTIA